MIRKFETLKYAAYPNSSLSKLRNGSYFYNAIHPDKMAIYEATKATLNVILIVSSTLAGYKRSLLSDLAPLSDAEGKLSTASQFIKPNSFPLWR